MTDRHEIARDFLLQHFKPEELTAAFAGVLSSVGMEAESSLMREPDAALRLVTCVKDAFGDEQLGFNGCPACDGAAVHLDSCELVADLRALSMSETPPRTTPQSPQADGESAP